MKLKPNNYRRRLSPITNTGTFLDFQLPAHPQTALVIERLVIVPFGSGSALVTGDIIRVKLALADNEPNLVNSVNVLILADTTWVVNGGGTGSVLGFNPPTKSGVEYSPPIRLAPSDDPAFIAVQATPHNFASDMYVTVEGWEIPTGEIGTFPPPDVVSDVI